MPGMRTHWISRCRLVYRVNSYPGNDHNEVEWVPSGASGGGCHKLNGVYDGLVREHSTPIVLFLMSAILNGGRCALDGLLIIAKLFHRPYHFRLPRSLADTKGIAYFVAGHP